jgi:glycyl-tRNA synthetase beta chain
MKNLLFEIGTEELPAGFLQPALQQLQDNFSTKAKELDLSYGNLKTMGSPRRITLMVENLADKQPDKREELLGPSKKAGFADDGTPTKAAEGFARSKSATPDDLKVVETPKGEYLMLVREVKGQETAALLPEVLHQLLMGFSFPKSMTWGSNIHAFARPLQWLLALYGNEVVEFKHEGLTSGNVTRGHRFLANHEVQISDNGTYENQLLEAHVIVDLEKRRKHVLDEVHSALEKRSEFVNAKVFIDENLVDTVTNLVEFPHGICGSFDEKFLALPDEVLITSMREHQKYFPIVDEKNNLLPGFIAVNNTQVVDSDVTRKGHQRVLRARLEDALFFFNGDKEQKLESRCEDLKGIIFQAKLGSMFEKNERIIKLSKMLAEKLEPDSVENCVRCATLCKSDLITDMVGEFPSLQGVMGGAYARHEGESEEVATGIEEHYMPKRAGAAIPTFATGAIVGLADRLDTIAGCFGIGQIPTGTADPFGLRRLTLAVLSIIHERGYTLSIKETVHKVLMLYGEKVDGSTKTVEKVVDFIKARYINDSIAKGNDAEAVEAVTSVVFDDINDCGRRVEAFMSIKKEAAFPVLASSFKRIRNIIKDNQNTNVNPALFQENSEKELFSLIEEVTGQVDDLVNRKEYLQAVEVLLKMKEPVDNFFEEVMVMADDDAVRQNRLNLLTALGRIVLQIGDISKMHE